MIVTGLQLVVNDFSPGRQIQVPEAAWLLHSIITTAATAPPKPKTTLRLKRSHTAQGACHLSIPICAQSTSRRLGGSLLLWRQQRSGSQPPPPRLQSSSSCSLGSEASLIVPECGWPRAT
jgi:hypothetical protein